MSDIPYSVRDKIANVTNIRGLNFADISDNELFKKTDEKNIGGAGIYVTDAGAISLGVNRVLFSNEDDVRFGFYHVRTGSSGLRDGSKYGRRI